MFRIARWSLFLTLIAVFPAYPADPDTDGDGIADPLDNCALVANADQRDTDCDGYGNLCDGDLDNNGAVSTPDLALFRKSLFTSNNPNADLNGDGVVSTPDLARFRQLLFKPPGPSGITPKLKNRCPTARAGADQSVSAGAAARLDGSGSTDLDGDRLTYRWLLEQRPALSQSALSSPNQPRSNLGIDVAGDYQARLEVSDGVGRGRDTIILSTGNVAPEAKAGPDKTVPVGQTARLDGSGSVDPNGDLLIYRWSIAEKPQGSLVQFTANATQAQPSLLLDKAGTYRFTLIVNDGQKDSGPDEVIVRTDNSKPTADAGPFRTGAVGTPLSFNGGASTDPDNDALSFSWSLLFAPATSTAGLADSAGVTPGLIPDLAGDYIAQLVVKDALQGSDPATVVVAAITNRIPLITSAAVTTGKVGQAYIYDVNATDADGDILTYLLTVSPVGMTINAPNGLISWTPAAAQTGSQSVTVTVSDGKGGFATQSFAVAVSSAAGQFSVPALVGKSRAAAEAAIDAAQLTLGTLSFQFSPTVPDGQVISQVPAANTSVAAGSSVNLTLSKGPDNGLPPNPQTVAPPADATVATTVADTTDFLYSGANALQKLSSGQPLAAGTIEDKRAAVIRGRVLNKANQPLPGAVISIQGHPELGQTQTRTDGQFDLAVNGGGYLTVNFNAVGFLPAQRLIDVPWQDFALAEDVVLIPVDGKVTTVSLAPNQPMQVAQGNIVNDADGSRRTTALFPTGTQATITLGDGSVRPLTSLSVRASEYTGGANGPATMPGELPPTSGYTYATELSIDEAQTAGAKSVDFNQPVPFYVDNFLNFPVGLAVPVGYYDKDKAAWIPSDNGRIVKIIAITAGKAEIDTDGNGSADNDAALGITDAERTRLAGLYPAGKTLWRVQVKHFTPWDCNWPYGPPPDADPPGDTGGDDGSPGDDGPPPDCSSGSIVECQTQVLGESIPLTGTPYNLNYRSSRMPGRKGGKTLLLEARDRVIPASVKRIEFQVTLAGRQFSQSVLPSASRKVRFDWDGLNVYGQAQQGTQTAQIKVGYVYDAIYYAAPGGFQQSFGRLSGVPIEGSRARQEVTLWKESETKLDTWDAGKQTLGGWTLNVHHSYDPTGKKLYMGDGSIRAEDFKAPVVEISAGTGTRGFSGDNGPATAATFNFPREVAAGPDGSLFLSDSGNNRIRKIDPTGKITTIAGTGVFGFGGDGGPATAARLRFPRGLVIGTDGSIYVADFLNNRIRKISPSGIITTVAGNGTRGFSGDGGLATEASFADVENLAVAPDGVLYVSDTGNHRIRVVGTDGIVTTLAGDGTAGFSGDGGFALNARIGAPRGIAIDDEGIVYFADSANARIRRIAIDGRIDTFAGTGTVGYSGDGGPALDANLGVLRGLTITRAGSICVSDFSNHRVRCVGADGHIATVAGNGGTAAAQKGAFATQTPLEFPRSITFAPDGGLFIARENANQLVHVTKALPGFDGGDMAIASEDGSLLYRFNQNGKHLATLNGLTGATLLTFGYDAEGRLIEVKDANGNITTLSRTTTGVLTGVVGPYGQKSDVSFDANGYLASVANPAGETFRMAYSDTGLLTEFRNPKGNASTFAYDENGRLTKDTNAAGGFQTLALTQFAGGFDVTKATALGRTTIFHTEYRPDGGHDRTRTYPDGTQEKRFISADGNTTAVQADGSTLKSVEATDPRFESARYTGSAEINTGGLKLTTSTQQTAVLSDAANPFSLTSLTQKTTLNGRVFNSLYDGPTRTLTTTTPVGRQSKTTIDTLGRTTQTQVTGILPVANTYDARGRLSTVTQGTGADQRTLSYAYNPLGYLQTATDPLGRAVNFEYDAAGRVTKQTLPDGRAIAFTYDVNGNLASLTPPGRPAHVFRYSSIDLNNEYVPPDVGAGTNSTLYDYNLDQQLTKISRPDGQTLDYIYDTGGRLSRLTIPDGHFDFAYDSTTGKLVSLTAPDTGRLDYTYTGSLLTKTTWSGTATGSVEYGYDNDLRLASVGLNNGSAIKYEYDGDGLLAKAGALSLTRSAQNRLLIGTALGKVNDTLAYNSFGEVTTYEAKYGSSPLLKEEYTRDKLGRITQKKETVGVVAHTYEYGYDRVGRLIQVKKDGVVVTSYAYDENGNRTSRTTPVSTATGTYDDQDRLLSYAGMTFGYTANGEIKSKTLSTAVTGYQYDVLGNLKHVDLPDGTKIDYLIDGQNRRIGKKVNGVLVQRLLWQDGLKPVAEFDGSGNLVSRFVYATRANVPNYLIKGDVEYRLITDHLGSPRLIVNMTTGTIVQEIDYDEFGNVLLDTNPGFQPFGFAGGLYDRNTSLIRYGVRDFDPTVGRWMLKDPIAFKGGINSYSYVSNNPIAWSDYSGYAPNQGGATDSCYVSDWLRENPNLGDLSNQHGSNTNRYFYTDKYGWVDIRHFGKAAQMTADGQWEWWVETLGFGNEIHQWLTEWGDSYRSGFSPEDLPSNSAGADFGSNIKPGENLADAFEQWAKENGARPINDPASGFDKLPATDPSEHGGKGRGSNSSSTPQGPGGGSSASSCGC